MLGWGASLVLIPVFIFGLTSSCLGKPAEKNLKRGQNFFVVGVGDYDYLPYTGIVEGKFVGFGAAVLEAFANSKGYSFEYKPLSVPRMFKEFLDDRSVDFMYPNNQYWGGGSLQKKNVIFSEPVVSYIDGVVVLEENKNMTLKELKTLVVMKGFDTLQYRDLARKRKIQIYEHSDVQSLLRMVVGKRMQGAYINPIVAAYQMNTVMNEKPLYLAVNLPYIESSYLLSTLKYKKVIEEFNEFLIKEKELIKRLKIQYQVEDPFLKDPSKYQSPRLEHLKAS